MARCAVLMLVSLILSGCLSSGGQDDDAEAGATFEACIHPWPCADGTEWPPDLEGPFDPAGWEDLSITMSDGIALSGMLVRPDVSPPTGLPTILVLTPYMDFMVPEDRAEVLGEFEAPQAALVEAGYAVAYVAHRGTWYSEGCAEYFTERSAGDAVETIAWLADAAWSNGRIGMMGVSYPTTMAWQAIHSDSPELKAIATGGNIHDPWLWGMTPQGLAFAPAVELLFLSYFATGHSTGVWVLPGETPYVMPRANDGSIRPCPGFMNDIGTGWNEPDRTGLAAQSTVPDMYNGQAAVLMLQGSQDGLLWSDEGFWADYAGPKAQMRGTWGHELPTEAYFADWPAPVIEWFDFWLKGLEPPELLGKTRFVTDAGAGHLVGPWPPVANRTAIYLGAGLHSEPVQFEAVLTAPLAPSNEFSLLNGTMTPPPCHDQQSGVHLTFLSDPLGEPVTLAGEALAWLDVEATSGRGGALLQLWKIASDHSCDQDRGFTLVTHGGFDLRYLRANAIPDDHPPGTQLRVRVDLNSMHHELAAGDKLMLVISPGSPGEEWGDQTSAGQVITFRGDGTNDGSHLILPIYEGAMPGGLPLSNYGERPFSRAWFED